MAFDLSSHTTGTHILPCSSQDPVPPCKGSSGPCPRTAPFPVAFPGTCKGKTLPQDLATHTPGSPSSPGEPEAIERSLGFGARQARAISSALLHPSCLRLKGSLHPRTSVLSAVKMGMQAPTSQSVVTMNDKIYTKGPDSVARSWHKEGALQRLVSLPSWPMILGALQRTVELCFLETRDQRPPSSQGNRVWLRKRPQRRCPASITTFCL